MFPPAAGAAVEGSLVEENIRTFSGSRDTLGAPLRGRRGLLALTHSRCEGLQRCKGTCWLLRRARAIAARELRMFPPATGTAVEGSVVEENIRTFSGSRDTPGQKHPD